MRSQITTKRHPRSSAEISFRRFLPIFPALALFLASCGGNPSTDEESLSDAETADRVENTRFTIETVSYSATEEDCALEDCTNIKVEIPQLRGEDDAVAEKINTAGEEQLRGMVKARLPEPMNAPWDVMMDSFMQGFEMFKLEFPHSTQKWFLHIHGKESQISGERFILHITDEEYMGGAHPNSYVILKTYDLNTGNEVDVLREFDLPTLERVAEEYFRRERGLEADAPLNDRGLMFPDSRFIVAENLAVVGDTLLMIYNPYEVAAYSEGFTFLNIPLSELRETDRTAEMN